MAVVWQFGEKPKEAIMQFPRLLGSVFEFAFPTPPLPLLEDFVVQPFFPFRHLSNKYITPIGPISMSVESGSRRFITE
jgi:hypothetical protein